MVTHCPGECGLAYLLQRESSARSDDSWKMFFVQHKYPSVQFQSRGKTTQSTQSKASKQSRGDRSRFHTHDHTHIQSQTHTCTHKRRHSCRNTKLKAARYFTSNEPATTNRHTSEESDQHSLSLPLSVCVSLSLSPPVRLFHERYSHSRQPRERKRGKERGRQGRERVQITGLLSANERPG